MSRKFSAEQQAGDSSRPKRRATNAHIFRYLQTRNPTKLEEEDLRRALEASKEECPDFWPEDSASCSSSEQSNATSTVSGSSGSVGNGGGRVSSQLTRRRKGGRRTNSNTKRRPKSMQLSHHHHHMKHQHNQSYMHNPYHHLTTSTSQQSNNSHRNTLTANLNCCPMSTVHNRYKPVAKDNIYNEADFFHDGIMEYIEFELEKSIKVRFNNNVLDLLNKHKMNSNGAVERIL